MSGGMTQNQASYIGIGVSLPTPNTLPDSIKSPTWNEDGEFTGWSVGGATPSGTGTELQIRGSATTLSHVTGSSYAGGVLTVPAIAANTFNGVELTITGFADRFLDGEGNYAELPPAAAIGMGVILLAPSSLPSDARFPKWNSDVTFEGWHRAVTPSGNGTELQYRASATTFGAVTDTSYDGVNLLLPVAVVAAVGSADIPSIAFLPDFNVISGKYTTGMYGGAGQVNVSIGGTLRARFNSSGLLLNTSFATQPAVSSFATGADGLFWPAAGGALGIAIGGLETTLFTAGTMTISQGSANTDAFDVTLRKSRGTVVAPTVITTGDDLGMVNFAGYSGAAGYVTGAAIKVVSFGTIATTRVPGILWLCTATDATPSVLTERLMIHSNGNVLIRAGGTSWPLTTMPPRELTVTGGGSNVVIGLYQDTTELGQIVGTIVSTVKIFLFEVGGDERFRCTQDANFSLGKQTTFGTSATKTFAQSSGTAPGSSPADCYQLYSADIAADHAAPHIRNENGTVLKLYQQAGIANADGTLADLTTKFNSLLSKFETNGFLAAA